MKLLHIDSIQVRGKPLFSRMLLVSRSKFVFTGDFPGQRNNRTLSGGE